MNPGWWPAARSVFELMVPIWETNFFSTCRILMTAKFSRERRGWADRKADGAPLEPLQVEWKSPFLFLNKQFSMENGFCQDFSTQLYPVGFNASSPCTYPSPQTWQLTQPKPHGQQGLLSGGPTALQKSRNLIFQVEMGWPTERFLMGNGSLGLQDSYPAALRTHCTSISR